MRRLEVSKQRGRSLDDLDWALLRWLQDDARATSAALARRLRLSPAGLQKRWRKLQAAGVIRGYATLVSREHVGLDLLCFVHVTLAHHRPHAAARFRAAMRDMPEVLECHYLTGEFDYVMKVVVSNHQALERFLFEKLMKVEGVDRFRTSIVLNEIKSSTALPLAPPRTPGRARRPRGSGAGRLHGRATARSGA